MIGRILRPHGLRGELSVEVRTDDPGQRFAAGSVLATDPPEAGPLTVTSSRWHSGRLLVSFDEVAGRTDAESLRGVLLTVDAAEVALPQDPDEFHDHQLTGLTVVTVSGEVVGTVSDVLHHGQDLLSITPAAGTQRRAEVLVPFVAAIAVEVDLAAGKLIIDPPPGLLDLAPDDTGPSPGSTSPGSTSPGSTSPGSTSPGSTSPGSTSPGSTSPGSTSPGSTSPGGTSPGGAGRAGARAARSTAADLGSGGRRED